MKKTLSLKAILLNCFKRDDTFIKILAVIKNSFIMFKNINKISLKFSIILIPEIIKMTLNYEKREHNKKNLIKLVKSEKKIYFEKKYKFDYQDWFFGNIPIWQNIVTKIDKIDYLEIGSFEGRSTVFIGELNNLNSIQSVDTWLGSKEHPEHPRVNFDKVFENFKKNLNIINKHKINYFKGTSDNFFKNNKNTYNLIYIDGSHHYNDIKKDFINSFNCLKKNGFLICDDFLWFYYDKVELNPINAILECYKNYKKNLKIEFLGYQIIFKKID